MDDYWEECIAEALCEAGLAATTEQINTIASWVEGYHDNYGMATGRDAIPNPMINEARERASSHQKEVDELQKEIEAYKNSVKTRRNANSVWIERGEVFYE